MVVGRDEALSVPAHFPPPPPTRARAGRDWKTGTMVGDRLQTGLYTYDPGFTATGSCSSSITFIDGDKGLCAYRGYPVDQLAEKSNFLEVRAKRGAPLASPLLPCAASIPHPPTR
jgi:hypothetical protein